MTYEAELNNFAIAPELLPALVNVTRVAHHGNFSRAAAELGISPSALSQSVRKLEERLGMRLLRRSTRHVSLTELGERLLAEIVPALNVINTAFVSASESRDTPSGILRLNVSRSAAEIVVLPHLAAFNKQYPDVIIDMHCSNDLTDSIAGGFDAGIRLGESLDLDRIAMRMGGPQRIATFAAPAYLQEHAAPITPADLLQHQCVTVRLAKGLYQWEFEQDGTRFDVETRNTVITNDGDLLVDVVRQGLGVGCAFEASVQEDFAKGTLVPLLEAWWPTYSAFYIYYDSRLHIPSKLKAFLGFMKGRF
ncbi:LysR family transcriptional regulator [Candidatus Pantoea formicae]|uniref:LysR family transcriptional regulator n=1 Tax=Candidatus Pantoea formicae TaxID=2608355 RepID=UPI003EDA526D